MSSIPTHDELKASLGHIFTLSSADEAALPLVQSRLLDAPSGVPMDETYECYSASFELPLNIRLPQDTYRFIASDGREWTLFATPVRPLSNGAGVLQATIHRQRADAPVATVAATTTDAA